jgi:hypothetical protein
VDFRHPDQWKWIGDCHDLVDAEHGIECAVG